MYHTRMVQGLEQFLVSWQSDTKAIDTCLNYWPEKQQVQLQQLLNEE